MASSTCGSTMRQAEPEQRRRQQQAEREPLAPVSCGEHLQWHRPSSPACTGSADVDAGERHPACGSDGADRIAESGACDEHRRIRAVEQQAETRPAKRLGRLRQGRRVARERDRLRPHEERRADGRDACPRPCTDSSGGKTHRRRRAVRSRARPRPASGCSRRRSPRRTALPGLW